MAETWRGIYPITSFVLEALGRKRDSGPAGALTEREQVLFCRRPWDPAEALAP